MHYRTKGKGMATKKTILFLKFEKKISPKNVATRGVGGGGKALEAGPLKNNFIFFAASLR